ncbi:MAG: hypothetical protein ABSC87_03825 [Halobacteriota archaeon]
MRKIFTTKISLQSRNPTFSYPIIRLPRDLKELAGQIVNIYETEIDGVRGFFVASHLAKLAKFDEPNDDACQIEKPPRGRYFVKAPQKTNGLGRIRTGDLRRVKATSRPVQQMTRLT